MKTIPSLIAGATLSIFAATGFANEYTFDTVENYNSLIGTGFALGASHSTTGGIGNSGSILVTGSTNNYAAKYFTEGDRLDTSAAITLSLNFQWITPTQSATTGFGAVVGIGSNVGNATLTPYVSPWPENNLSGADRDEIYVGIRANGQGSDVVNLLSGGVNKSTGTLRHTPTTSSTNGTLVSGNWYYLEAILNPLTDETGFSVDVALYNADASTGAAGSVIFSDTLNLINSNLVNQSVNSFLAVRASPWGGVSHIDNLAFTSAIPEPSMISAFVLGSGLILLYRRQRRRNS